MDIETRFWNQIEMNDINKRSYLTRNEEYMRITVSATAKLFCQNMGSFKCFNIDLLSRVTLYTPSLAVHTRNNFSDFVNDVMRRRSVKGCSALAILRGLYIRGAPVHRPFPFSLWWWRCNKFRSSRIRVHPTPSPNSNWTELNFIWYTMPPKFDPTEIKVGMSGLR